MRLILLMILFAPPAFAVPVTELLSADEGSLELIWGEVKHSERRGTYSPQHYCEVTAEIAGFDDKQPVQRLIRFHEYVSGSDTFNAQSQCASWAAEKIKPWAELFEGLALVHTESKKITRPGVFGGSVRFGRLCYRNVLAVNYHPPMGANWMVHSISALREYVPCAKGGAP